jgi:hypothetical protein
MADLGSRVRWAGPQSVSWDGVDSGGRDLPSGVYLARLMTSAGTASRKIVLARLSRNLKPPNKCKKIPQTLTMK